MNKPNILALVKSEKSARKRMRYLALLHFTEGHSRTAIATMLKVSRTSVNKWVTTYLSQGLSGLDDKPNPGRPPQLSLAQLACRLKAFVQQRSLSEQGGRLMAKATIRDTPGHVALDHIDVWFQDEARFGQQNTTTRIWAKKGTRPRAVRQQQFESAYLYGAVCPATGATEAIIAPHANSEYMYQHLKLISAATTFGCHALIIMDGAGWHQQALGDDFDNLTVLKLPPYSPELNPIEQVWQWLRQNVLANRCFSGYDDIVEQCSIAWNSFIENKERVSKLCSRRWAMLTS